MENDDGKKNGNGTSSELPAASDAQNNQAKQIGKSRSTSKESDGDKKKILSAVAGDLRVQLER